MKKIAICLMILCIGLIADLAYAYQTNWIYITTSKTGCVLYYDSYSVFFSNDYSRFYVTTRLIYSPEGKKNEIEWAKNHNYYTPAMENMAFLEEDLFFDTPSYKVDLDYWAYFRSDGQEIFWDSGPYYEPIDKPNYLYKEVYDRVRKDYNIY